MAKPDAKAVSAEILTIGDELNRGEIVDTNSSWLAERLTDLGLHVRWRTSVTDDAPDLTAAVENAAARARLVVASGGLGPTDDDRTVDVLASVLGVPPVNEAAHEQAMRARFADRSFRLTPNNLRQVRVPSGAAVLANRNGLAPGFVVAHRGAELYFMPGVPREMKPMFDDQAAPRIRRLLGEGRKSARRTWRVAGLGESHVDHALRGLLDGVADATLHFRIAFPENLVTVVVRRDDDVEARHALDALDREVRARLGESCYGLGDQTLAQRVGARLAAASATLALAESCTGGLVGELITSVPGASAYFRGGLVAYADEIKRALLGVRAETLAAHGAVSRETAIEMAEGARRSFGASWAAAVSGIAGPGGGTPEKPVGTVELAVVGPGVVETRHLFWPPAGAPADGREQVRRVAAFALLHLLYKALDAPATEKSGKS